MQIHFRYLNEADVLLLLLLLVFCLSGTATTLFIRADDVKVLRHCIVSNTERLWGLFFFSPISGAKSRVLQKLL